MGRLTQSQRNDVTGLYLSGLSCRQIAEKFGCTAVAICLLLKRRGVTLRSNANVHRKYRLSERVFDQIDTEAKAYFLGLLFADGCNTPDRNSVTLGLVVDDWCILERFCEFIGTDKPIKRVAKGHGWKDQGRVEVNSRLFSQDLEKHGMTARKSLTLAFPTAVPPHLLHHFVRGYFDGDGCFTYSIRSNGSLQAIVSFECSEMFAESIGRYIFEVLGEKSCVESRTGKSFAVRFSGNKKAMRVMEWMYSDATVWMPRKRNKYEEFVRLRTNRLESESPSSAARWGRKKKTPSVRKA